MRGMGALYRGTGQAFRRNDGGLVKATYGDESVDSRSLQRRLNPRAWGLDTGFRRYDDVGWPGAIFVPMTVVRAAPRRWVAGLVGADRGRGGWGEKVQEARRRPRRVVSTVEGESPSPPYRVRRLGGRPSRFFGGDGCRPATSPTGGRTRGSAPTTGESPSPQPSPVEGEGVRAPISIFPPNGGRGGSPLPWGKRGITPARPPLWVPAPYRVRGRLCGKLRTGTSREPPMPVATGTPRDENGSAAASPS